MCGVHIAVLPPATAPALVMFCSAIVSMVFDALPAS
jgi:hypothetical protein